MIRRAKGSPANKKVKNATPQIINGIKFRSKLEVFMYNLLLQFGIIAEYESHRFILIPSFKYEGKTQRAITYTPDFVGEDFIIECKGWGNDVWPLKKKMFMKHILDNNINKKFYVAGNQKECHEVVLDIIKRRKDAILSHFYKSYTPEESKNA